MSAHPVREVIRRGLAWFSRRAGAPAPTMHRIGRGLLVAQAALLVVAYAHLAVGFVDVIRSLEADYAGPVGAVVLGFTLLSYLPHVALLAAPLLAVWHVHRAWMLDRPVAPVLARVLAGTTATVGVLVLTALATGAADVPGAAAEWLRPRLPWIALSQALLVPTAAALFALTWWPSLRARFHESASDEAATLWRAVPANAWRHARTPPGRGLRERLARGLAFMRTPAARHGPHAYRGVAHALRSLCWMALGILLGGILFFAFALFLFVFLTVEGPAAFLLEAPHRSLLGTVVLFIFLTLAALLAALAAVLGANAAYLAWLRRGAGALAGALGVAGTLAGLAALGAIAPAVPPGGPLLAGADPGVAAPGLGAAALALAACSLRADVRAHVATGGRE